MEGHGRDRVSLNYRSFMFGKLPPPACPGPCYVLHIIYIHIYTHICIYYIYIDIRKIQHQNYITWISTGQECKPGNSPINNISNFMILDLRAGRDVVVSNGQVNGSARSGHCSQFRN